MDPFPIRTLIEADIDSIVEEAGGARAHPDQDRRNKKGADYVFARTVIELKMLDDEGFSKPERQEKLAKLFREGSDSPVIVIDPASLSPEGNQKYRRIVEGPIKSAIAKAKKQLVQTRSEFSTTVCSVLWIVNNGYTALDHDTLEEVVAHRIRQDTTNIDGVIVSGCYYHSDGFDSVFLWPCTYVPINLAKPFAEFETLQKSFHAFVETYMSELVMRKEVEGDKPAVNDFVFEFDGVRYVRPAPIIGTPSDFYINGRPRANSSNIDTCPPVGLILPRLTRPDFDLIASVAGEHSYSLSDRGAWDKHEGGARAAGKPLQPLIEIDVDAETWLQWCQAEEHVPALPSLNHYAHKRFDEAMLAIIDNAREMHSVSVVLSRYVLVVTHEIGQDMANDVSHIAIVTESANTDPIIRSLAENLRIFHEHAVVLAAAYALREGVEIVLWGKNLDYVWR